MVITSSERFIIYANPAPLLVSRQAVFPGLVLLPDGELLAMFSIGQAFDAADMRAVVSRSGDGGRSWSAPEPLHGGTALESESFKPVLLPDGRLLAAGYVFERPDELTPLVDPETSRLLPLRNKVMWSDDGGRSWTPPRTVSVEGAALELSGPAIVTAGGRLLAACAPFHLSPDNHEGWLIESTDGGESWHRRSIFYREGEDGVVAPWECRLCELPDGRIAVQFWAYDPGADRNLNLRLCLSDDGGTTFGPAIDTGLAAQASNLMPLSDGRLLTINAHREDPVGLVLRVCRPGPPFAVEEEHALLGSLDPAMAVQSGAGVAAQFGSLKFGQPSLLRLSAGAVIACCWMVEDGQHVIAGWRLALDT